MGCGARVRAGGGLQKTRPASKPSDKEMHDRLHQRGFDDVTVE